MSRQQFFPVVVVLTILFLVGCGASASTVVPNAPAANSTPEQPTSTPQPPPATPTPEPPPATEEAVSAVDSLTIGDPDRGRQIFENGGEKYADKPDDWCIHCHSLDGSEGYGPSMQGISERAGDRVPELSAAEYIRQSILEPDAYVVEDSKYLSKNIAMGRFPGILLSEEELNDLIAFLLTQ